MIHTITLLFTLFLTSTQVALGFIPYTTSTIEQEHIHELSYEQRFNVMKEDMLLKIIILYTIEKYIIAPLEEIVALGSRDKNLTNGEENILIAITLQLKEKDFIVDMINNKKSLTYAYYKGTIPVELAMVLTPEEEVYGALLYKSFQILLTYAKSIEHAYNWMIRIMTANPYWDYNISYQEVNDFYQTAPIQPLLKDRWQQMWSSF